MSATEEKRLRMTITFPEYEKELYEYIKSQKNSSALIRKLILAHMLSGGETISISNGSDMGNNSLSQPTTQNNKMDIGKIIQERKENIKDTQEESLPKSEDNNDDNINDTLLPSQEELDGELQIEKYKRIKNKKQGEIYINNAGLQKDNLDFIKDKMPTI